MLEDFDLEQIVEPLLGWFEKNARTLPWRSVATPYRVWVSEIMLQHQSGSGKTVFCPFYGSIADSSGSGRV